MEISLDFETRSTIDLRKTGAYRYAEDPTTDVWCAAFALPGEDPLLWAPDGDDTHWVNLCDLARDRSVVWRAWNAPFERAIWREVMHRRYGLPDIPVERWVCTAVEARAMGLPNKLEDCARVLGVEQQKDQAGHRLMLRMAKPRRVEPDGSLVWWDDAERKERLFEYCRQDIRTEQAIAQRVQRLTEYERRVWLLDQRANDAGVRLDAELARAALDVAAAVTGEANERLAELTNGAVERVTNLGQMKNWFASQGLDVESITKKTIATLLDDPDLPDGIREALEIRSETGKSSVKKIDAMLRAACLDGNLRGLLLYWGAGTGRWAGRLVQPQNFPARTAALPEWHDPEAWIDPVLARDVAQIELYAAPLEVVSLLLRSMLTARPGKVLVAADYSAIEARVIAWLCGEQWRLDVFSTHGRIYEASASMMFKIQMEEFNAYRKAHDGKHHPARQKGKVAELALGFQGGVNALVTMGAYEMGLGDDELPEIVKLWREASPNIKNGWNALQRAALEAVQFPGRVVECELGHGVRFKVSGGWLWMKLPSGRRLAYCQPKIVEKPAPWDPERTVKSVEAWSVHSKTKRWSKRSLYGGLLMENLVQATARDLMADAMLRLEAHGVYTPLLSVHDEVITEADENLANLDEFIGILCQSPAWAQGCPVAADGFVGYRYRK